jgi:hypothetical protein
LEIPLNRFRLAFALLVTSSVAPAVAADIANFAGSGNANTQPFTTTTPWEAQFTGPATFQVMSSDGQMAGSIGGMSGSYSSSKTGTFHFQVTAAGAWQIRVISAAK